MNTEPERDSIPALRAKVTQLQNSLAEAHEECDQLIDQRDEEAQDARTQRLRAEVAERERDHLAYLLLRATEDAPA